VVWGLTRIRHEGAYPPSENAPKTNNFRRNNHMKKFKVIILAALFTLVFSVGVFAKEDTHRAAVEQLMTLMKVDRIYEQMYPQIKQLVLQQLQQINTPQEQSPLVEKYFNKLFDTMKEEMGWDKMKEDFIQLYMSVYTEQEIQKLIAFYKTPVGQKAIEKTPVIMQQSMAISQKYLKNMMPKIQKIVEEMVTEITTKSKDEKN
jgi:hypothetical protein